MGTVANRTATLSGIAQACTLGIAIAACFAGTQATAQAAANPPAAAKPPAPATYSGCVQKAPDSTTDLVISTPKVCALLTREVSAKLSIDALAGHQVELTGILTPRTSSAPASIQVNSVGSVGKACTDVCALKPPMSRGLHRPTNGEIPGSEGGTPGLTTTPHQ